jgi:hypothetical protein
VLPPLLHSFNYHPHFNCTKSLLANFIFPFSFVNWALGYWNFPRFLWFCIKVQRKFRFGRPCLILGRITTQSQSNQALICFQAKWDFPQGQSNRLKQKNTLRLQVPGITQRENKINRNFKVSLCKSSKLQSVTILGNFNINISFHTVYPPFRIRYRQVLNLTGNFALGSRGTFRKRQFYLSYTFTFSDYCEVCALPLMTFIFRTLAWPCLNTLLH